jgi:hypothetical protein
MYGRDGIGWVLLYMSSNATTQAKQAISDGDADGESKLTSHQSNFRTCKSTATYADSMHKLFLHPPRDQDPICRASATVRDNRIGGGGLRRRLPAPCTAAPAAPCIDQLAPPAHPSMHECQRVASPSSVRSNESIVHARTAGVLQRPNQCAWSFSHCSCHARSIPAGQHWYSDPLPAHFFHHMVQSIGM